MTSKPSQMCGVAQLVLSSLCLVLALCVLGTSSHVYATYRSQTAANNPWWLPLWPQHFETTNTKIFIGVAAALVLLNLFYLVVSWLPRLQLSSRPTLKALTTFGVAVPCIFLTLTAVVFDAKIRSADSPKETIREWTCRFNDVTAVGGMQAKMPHDQSNANFSSLCNEAIFNFGGMITLLILETLLLFSAVGQWFWQTPATVYRQDEKSTSDINVSTPTKGFEK